MATSKPSQLNEHLEKFKDTIAKRKKYIKNEYQSYGMELAQELGDWKNRALYMRMAKNIDRQVLEKARLFIKDQDKSKIKTPYKLFMWKLKELRMNK